MDGIMRCDEEDKIRRLYEATMEGSVDTLKSLIQNDPYGKTPLHVSASFGHLNFTKKLLSIKPEGPKLAMELDRLKRSPLHLASAEGHTDIVKALIQVNEGMCLATDQYGKIPLHYAAMRGRVEVIRLLIGSQRQSIWEYRIEGGETVLHLCVQYNQLEALKVLVESVGWENNELLNSKDQNGNTILHLAVMLKQVETAEYLLSLPEVRAGASTENQSGLNAFGLVKHLPKDFKSLKIQNAFQDVGFQREKQQHNCKQLVALCIKKFYEFLQKHDKEWIKDKTGSLMIVATVIATMTYQTATNPPGGVWQESRDDTVDCTSEKNCTAGTAVLAHKGETEYLRFLIYNSMAFISSVVIIFLLISGFPVRYTPCVWLFYIFICSALTFLTLTFQLGMYLVSPSTIEGVARVISGLMIFITVSFIGVMGLLQIICILVWIVKKFQEMFKCKWKARRASGNHNSYNAARV